MSDIVTFDPVNLRIIEIDTMAPINTLSAQEIYSEWKDWLLADPSRLGYPFAFSEIGGDPKPGGAVGITTFLENGWKIRPAETTHKLVVEGNLFARDGTSIFVATLGAFNVHTETQVSNIVDQVVLGGIDQATVQAALTAQGYTTTRAPKIDNLDTAVSTRAASGGLTLTQETMLLEMYRLLGLDPTKPLVVTSTSRRVPANGSDVNQTIVKVGDEVTVTRI